jgi:hypothetical protein
LQRDVVPYTNSPLQHLLRKEFVQRVGSCFRVELPATLGGSSFTCTRPHIHTSGSTSGDLREPRIPGLVTSLDKGSLSRDFESHWRRFLEMSIRRSLAAVHKDMQTYPGLLAWSRGCCCVGRVPLVAAARAAARAASAAACPAGDGGSQLEAGDSGACSSGCGDTSGQDDYFGDYGSEDDFVGLEEDDRAWEDGAWG